MINSEFIISKTNSIYDAFTRSKEAIEDHNEKTLMSDDDYLAARYKLRGCVFDLQKALYFGNEKEVERLNEEVERTKKELSEIKKSLNVKELIYLPKCKICQDTGRVGDRWCHCRYETMTQAAYQTLNIPKPTFHTFAENTLTDERSEKLIGQLKKYSDEFGENSKNLLFFGLRGTGKTFLAECIADQINKTDRNVIFINSFQLNDIFLSLLYAKSADYLVAKEILTTSDLLVIDDLGAARTFNNVTAENLLMIVSERLTLKKPFIITTNLELDEIGARYGERVFSRMCGKSTVKIRFENADMRLK